jgi:aldehyde:ferredoxin oxidoreductase
MRLSRLLFVDLGRRRAWCEPLGTEERRRVGGAALGAALLERLLPPDSDPFDPASPWILSVGPLSGGPLSPRPQCVVTHLSPLTGGINDSVVTHPLAHSLATGGLASVILIGASEAPIWLRLQGERVSFEDARHLWGKDLRQAASALRAAGGSPALAVGPAAESGVLYACVGSEGHSAGRGGPGTALAAKRVKGIVAVATEGSPPPGAGAPPASAESPSAREPRGRRALDRLRLLHESAGLPTRNFRGRSFEGTAALSAALEDGARHLPYEGVFAFGPLIGVSDAAAVLGCIERCDLLGLDVISAGGSLGWGMEAVERGCLEAPLLRFGDGLGAARWLDAIARREAGPGEVLALGCRRGSERLGRDSASLAMHVRGLEIPGYDPRAFPTLALGYAVGSRGACHVRSGAYQADFDDPLPDSPDPDEVARRAADFEDRSTLLDSLILSRSWRADLGEPFSGAARLLREAGDADLGDPEALRQSMREVADVRRRINLSRGWLPENDTLPQRLLVEDGGAPSLIDPLRLRSWVHAYYRRRGWSAGGHPLS